MALSPSCPQAVRFYALIAAGHSLGSSVRKCGFHKEAGYRLLGARYVQLRRSGLDPDAALAALGVVSSRAAAWERQVDRDGRHHLRVAPDIEARFWEAFEAGESVPSAAGIAGAGRASGYRWLQRRFEQLRGDGVRLSGCARVLRLRQRQAATLERQWQQRVRLERSAAAVSLRQALASSAAAVSAAEVRTRRGRKPRQVDEARYWQLMRSGVSNAEACRILGVSRRTGTRLRRQAGYRIPAEVPSSPITVPSRYLVLQERLQIADLHRLGLSLRRIAAELGRSPSTISRELRRHADTSGAYLPHVADDTARRQRARPKPHRLVADAGLRQVVQRKLNQFWSPEAISGWLRKTYPADPARWVCHETIYRALFAGSAAGLHPRYTGRLRTGRRLRKTRWNNPVGRGSRIRNMRMLTERPVEASDKQVAGHWEGDLIVGVGSVSAMVTLRERTTQYGIVVNLPEDHTARSVNAAIAKAFEGLPTHLKRSLTWDQGVEMAAHEQLTADTGVPVFFADRSSPWQRGANENFNGLLRQYFPKGTDLAAHSRDHVRAVMNQLNSRPRKTLAYDTPASRFGAEKRRRTPAPVA